MAETIVALATPPGAGGIAVVRLSGEEALTVAAKVFFPHNAAKKVENAKGYTALYGNFVANGKTLDDGVALFFRAPHSYTGEDVAELSCHGGPVVAQSLIDACIAAGARPAGPGEYTRRAFLNGRMDLTQAEAVMELIGAGGEQAAREAQAGSSGVLSQRVEAIREELTGLGAHLAAWADFPEEDVPAVENQALSQSLEHAAQELSRLLESFDVGKVYREGVRTVIAGRPNAGKSTLMNLLAGCQRSIVTQYAGTTRDVVEETVLLGGIPLRLADTAGLRDTDDPVESIGVAAARERVQTADLVLAVFDSSQELEREDLELAESLSKIPAVAVVNKTDLPSKIDLEQVRKHFSHVACISAASGEGLEELQEEITALLGAGNFDPGAGMLFTERQRHHARAALEALGEAENALALGMTLDAVTVCVEDALNALYALTGETASEEVVDQVFETFCVGK